jgi:hypothetical protein
VCVWFGDKYILWNGWSNQARYRWWWINEWMDGWMERLSRSSCLARCIPWIAMAAPTWTKTKRKVRTSSPSTPRKKSGSDDSPRRPSVSFAIGDNSKVSLGAVIGGIREIFTWWHTLAWLFHLWKAESFLLYRQEEGVRHLLISSRAYGLGFYIFCVPNYYFLFPRYTTLVSSFLNSPASYICGRREYSF